jgi:hypothetical protein
MSEQAPATRPPEGRVPSPAHPEKRREALPQHEPKSHLDDPDAPARVATRSRRAKATGRPSRTYPSSNGARRAGRGWNSTI